MIKPNQREDDTQNSCDDLSVARIGEIPGMSGERQISRSNLAQAFSLLARAVAWANGRYDLTEGKKAAIKLRSAPAGPPLPAAASSNDGNQLH